MRLKVFDWKRLNQLGSREEQLAAMKFALDFFFLRPLIERGDVEIPPQFAKACKALGVKITTPSTTPNTSSVTPLITEVYVQKAQEDFGYLEIFGVVDMRGKPQKTFDIMDVTSGLTFNQRKPGEEAKFYSISDAVATVPFLEFAAGMGFLDQWFQFQEYYKFDDVAGQVRRKWYSQKALLHYLLVTALTGIDQAFATDDATTIDTACAAIENDCEELGLYEGDAPGFVILANPALRRRLTKSVYPFSQNPNDTTAQPPTVNISRMIFTPKVAATHYWIGIPGGKNKRADWMDLSVEDARDIKKSAKNFVWRGQYNAAIGEKKQWKKCALA